MRDIRDRLGRGCWSVRLAFALVWMVVLVVGCGTEPAPPPASGATSSAGDDTATPTAIRIPSIGVDGRDIIPLGLLVDGSMQTPPLSKPLQAGWYCPASPPKCGSPTPGEVGPAVVAAHVDANHHLGLFYRLREVKAGATVEVERSDGKVAVFKVTEVEILKKAAFPSAKVYGNTPGPELRLITCGPGELQTLPDGTRSYVNQTIVYATLTDLRSKT